MRSPCKPRRFNLLLATLMSVTWLAVWFNGRPSSHNDDCTFEFETTSTPAGELTYNSTTNDHIKATLALIDQHIEVSREKFRELSPWDTAPKNVILLVSSWRSGSTFLAEMLAYHPTVFLHYEPLWHCGVEQIRFDNGSREVVRHLKALLQCKFRNPLHNKAISSQTEGLMNTNVHTWDACVDGPSDQVCSLPGFLERACRKFPTVAAKIVRLRLNLTRTLLEDPDFSQLRIVYLVRDPRATLLSRKDFVWCTASRDCIDPRRLCDDIDSDLNAFQNLSTSFPGKLMMVKYETLAVEPLQTFESIFNFTGLPFLTSVNETIRRHTSLNGSGGATTFRKSAERIDRWKRRLGVKIIKRIQDACSPVLERLRYARLRIS